MNFISKLSKFAGRARNVKSAGLDQNRFFSSDTGQSSNFNNSKDYINAYQLVNYVGNAVSLIAGDIASLDWELTDRQGQKVQDIDIEALLNEPSHGLTWNGWIARSVQHLLLDGNVFWLLDQTNALAQSRNSINELKLLNPALVYVHDSDSEEIRSNTQKISNAIGFYRVQLNNSFVQIEPDNICHVTLPSPHNQLRGMGKVQSNAGIMDSERLTSIFNNTFFRQGAKLDYAITPDPEMGPGEFDLYKKSLRAEYEGQSNYSKLFIAPPGSKVNTLSISQKDMDLVSQRQITRQDIYSFFNIPPIISGNLDLAKYDSAGEQAKIYYDVDLPRTYKILEAGINKVIRAINPNVFFRFVPKNIIDQEKQNAISKDLFDRGAITANEYRERIGMSVDMDSPSLNTHWVSSNLLPVDVALMPPAPLPESPEEDEPKQDEEEKEKSVTGSTEAPISTKQSRKQMQIHIAARTTKQRIEKSFERMTKNFYRSMENRVTSSVKSLQSINTKQVDIDNTFNFDEETSEARKVAHRAFTSAVTLAITDVNKSVGSDVDPSFSNPKVKLVVEKLNRRYADLTINSRREEIRALLQTSIDEGMSISELKSSLQEYFKTLNGRDAWRAQRIARTEASYAWDQAAEIGYRDIGVTTVDVIGCEDAHEPWDCNKSGFSISEVPNLNFHPNHTGTVVPSQI